jgi:hypothetical protein
MSCSDIAILAAALVSLAGSIVSLFISTRLAVGKERRQLIWSTKLARFLRLEELAGDLVESLGGYHPITDGGTDVAIKLKALEDAAGRFGRYADVRQAIRDLHNTLSRMLAAKLDREDDRKTRAELDPAYQKLLGACDRERAREKKGSA